MASHEDTVVLARAWLAKAGDDLAVAELIERSGQALGWAAAFHCQQAVEKCIKARLILAGIEPPMTHSFAVLAKLAVGLAVPFNVADYQQLQPYAAAERYPIVMPAPLGVGDVARLLVIARRAVAWFSDVIVAVEARL